MRHNLSRIRSYLPWLFLLFGIDGFSALLLWLANAKAFYSMAAVIVLASVLLFFTLCGVLIRQELKKEQAFYAFLNNPDEYQEELLMKAVFPDQREKVRFLGNLLRENKRTYRALKEQLTDYEEYVESWAHEIKTPLSLLTLLLDNRREELPDTICYKLDHIRSRMQESVNQMLFYARLKGGRKDYLFEYLPIRSCIEEVLEDYKPLLEEKQFRIQCNLSDGFVYSDRRGLLFLLGQIVSNSIKYCGENPELSFVFSQQEDHCVLSIKDHGIGIRACDLPYIFEKGFTGDSGADRKRATGMGLYLAKGIAKELNLSLEAESVWGEGVEMRILFPVVASARGQAPI